MESLAEVALNDVLAWLFPLQNSVSDVLASGNGAL